MFETMETRVRVLPPPIPFHDLTQQPDDELPPDPGVLQFHEYANFFLEVDIQSQDFLDLVGDIIETGRVMQPIIKYQGQILDGRHRYLAWQKALETNSDAYMPEMEEFDGTDEQALDLVISANLKRRHLDTSQRAMVMARISKHRKRGVNQHTENSGPSLPKLAKTFKVSVDTGQFATRVLEKGVPELVRRVDRGEVAASVAAKVADMPEEQQRTIAQLPNKAVPGAVKKVQRAAREKDLGEATRVASKKLGTELYNVIYADPPWRFEPRSRDTGMDRAADNHYPTMTIEDISALKIPAADNCVLFLWATAPMERLAHEVMEAWGFTYKSQFIWVKDHVITGYWNRNQHEILLIGTRGDVPAPAPGEQYSSVHHGSSGKHSEKPFKFMEMIETMFPNLSKLEMFARGGEIAGWDRWGSEVTLEPEAA